MFYNHGVKIEKFLDAVFCYYRLRSEWGIVKIQSVSKKAILLCNMIR